MCVRQNPFHAFFSFQCANWLTANGYMLSTEPGEHWNVRDCWVLTLAYCLHIRCWKTDKKVHCREPWGFMTTVWACRPVILELKCIVKHITFQHECFRSFKTTLVFVFAFTITFSTTSRLFTTAPFKSPHDFKHNALFSCSCLLKALSRSLICLKDYKPKLVTIVGAIEV